MGGHYQVPRHPRGSSPGKPYAPLRSARGDDRQRPASILPSRGGPGGQAGGAGQCSIIGLPLRTSVTNAALANGAIAHGDEVDSTGQQGTGHYAATTVPAALSVAQQVGATGQDFMRALTLGSEVAARFQSVLAHYGTRPPVCRQRRRNHGGDGQHRAATGAERG